MPDASNAPAAADTQESRFAVLPVANIKASLTNPRKHFDQRLIDDLAQSIRLHGVAQPILVRPLAIPEGNHEFEIVAGERRWRAVLQLQLDTIPAMVRELSDLQALEIQVIENLQRADLHELEEAEGYEQLMKKHAFTSEQVADKIGKSRSYVWSRLKLTALSPAARKAFYAGELTSSTALLVARIPHEKLQAEALKAIAGKEGGELSFRAARAYVHDHFMLRLAEAPFSKSDATLDPKAGPCTTCPKRTGNQPELFADVASADVCTDSVCFAGKRRAFNAKAMTEAAAAGTVVIKGKEAKALFPYENVPDAIRGSYSNGHTKNYSDPKYRTNAEIAKAAGIKAALVERPDGKLVEVYEEKAIEAAVKKSQPKQSTSSGPSPSEKARNLKVLIAKETRWRTLVEVTKAADENMTSADWLMITCEVVNNLDHECCGRLVKLRGWQKEWADWGHQEEINAAIAALTDGDRAILILQATLVGDLGANAYSTSEAEQLNATAGRHGVDVKAIEQAVKLEHTPKAKLAAKKKAKASDKAIAVKYRNDQTGETWTGRGTPPKWIEGRDRAAFLVAPEVAA